LRTYNEWAAITSSVLYTERKERTGKRVPEKRERPKKREGGAGSGNFRQRKNTEEAIRFIRKRVGKAGKNQEEVLGRVPAKEVPVPGGNNHILVAKGGIVEEKKRAKAENPLGGCPVLKKT